MADLSPAIEPGALIAGRYRVERLLARGGHGAVYEAEDLPTEARVALKILLPHVLASDEARVRFALESKIAGRVGSEFIVRVLDAGVDEKMGLPFLAMELLAGESLADAVQKHGPMAPLDVATCLLQVAQGLDKAHSYRAKDGQPTPIIHRDLKPENLFLCVREDGERMAKILDFGLAKVLSESVVPSRDINGSPLYMAHEQLLAAPLGPCTDVWALGLIAFFLLTGKSYWRAASSQEAGISAIFAEILHMPIVPPSQRARDFGIEPAWPSSFDPWFLRCVNRDQAARFSTAGEAAESLLRILALEMAPETQPIAFEDRAGHPASSSGTRLPGVDTLAAAGLPRRLRRSTAVLGGAIVFALAIAGTAYLTSRRVGIGNTATTTSSRPRPEPPAAPSRPPLQPLTASAPLRPVPSARAVPKPKPSRRSAAAGTSGSGLDSPVYSER